MQISGHRMLQDCCGQVCRQPASGVMLAAHLCNMCSTFCIHLEMSSLSQGMQIWSSESDLHMFLKMLHTCEGQLTFSYPVHAPLSVARL